MSLYQRLEQALAARERDGTLRELPLVSYSDNRILISPVTTTWAWRVTLSTSGPSSTLCSTLSAVAVSSRAVS